MLSCITFSNAIAQPLPSDELPEFYVGTGENEVLLSLAFEDETEDDVGLDLTLEKSSGVATNVKIVERKDLSSLSERVFEISFDIAADIEPGKVETLIFVPVSNQILSYDADSLQFSFRTIEATERSLPEASSGHVVALPLRADAPFKFEREDAIDYIDPDRKDTTVYDRIVVFYSPSRSYEHGFMWQISTQVGIQSSIYGYEYDDPDYSYKPAKEGSPAKFAAITEINKPGVYKLITCPVVLTDYGLLGQSSPSISPNRDKCQEEGAFEVVASQLHFQGFIMEPFPPRALPPGDRLGESNVTLKKTGKKNRVQLALEATWENVVTSNYGVKKSTHQTYATGEFTFPKVLDPNMREMGKGLFKVEQPPDLEWLNKNAQSPYYDLWILTVMFHVGELHAIGQAPPEREMFFPPNASRPYGVYVPEYASKPAKMWQLSSGRGGREEEDLVFERKHKERHTPFGIPKRSMAAHLQDDKTIFVIPLKIELFEYVKGHGDNNLKLQIWGYAVYGAQPGQYNGPLPTSHDAPAASANDQNNEVLDSSTHPGDKGQSNKETGIGYKPNYPQALLPDNPKVSALIKEWIGQAEPVANASGADLRFDKWGRKEGRTVGGIITINGSPDDISGRTPEAYVWDVRDKRDSVDHCTLGEYVTAKLGDKSISHCVGRHKPNVANVAGMSKKSAEGKLQGTGLKTKVSLGSPASTAKDSLKVEKTIPDIGSTVNRGDMVTIVIHTPFVDTRTVPDFRGVTAKKVISKIKKAGLTPKISMVKATSSDQTGKVSALDPSPGTKLKPGATVQVDVFGPYVKTITVPNVKGSKAKEGMNKIKRAGLVPKINMVKAASAGQTGRISSLNPSQGTELKAGATVVVDVYGPYVRTVNVPNLKALTEKEARKKLDALGLKLNVLDHRETDNANQAGKIKSQSPESGTTVKAGKTIDLVVYKQSRPDCAKWPGSAALWNQKKQKYECDCTGDYERNNANSACRIKKSLQLAKAKCTDYNHQSEARWDGEDEKVYCYCNKGYKWNKNKTACEMNRESIIANTDCSSGGPYGEAYWDYEYNEASCRCMSGYKLNSRGKCVERIYARVESDSSSQDRNNDVADVLKAADDLMKIFAGNKSGSSSNRNTRTPQKTVQKKRKQNTCGSNFSVNGSMIDCRCTGWGFDPKSSQCRKGFSDKYSSNPSNKGKVYAGFGNAGGGSGSSHVCVDRNVRADGLSTMYSRGYGGGHESFTVKGNIICVGSKFYKISSNTVERHSCPGKNMTGCQLEWTKKIESRERRGNGGYKIIYKNGGESIVVTPK